MSQSATEDQLSVEYYFAYGSNMNPARMRSRVGEVRRALTGRLNDWQLAFNKRSRLDGLSHANVCSQPGAVVEGVLYQLTAPAQILAMDPFEGHPQAYRRHVKAIETDQGALSAWVYIAPVENTADNGLPAREYLDHLLAGRDYLSGDYYSRLCRQPCIDELDDESLAQLGIHADTVR